MTTRFPSFSVVRYVAKPSGLSTRWFWLVGAMLISHSLAFRAASVSMAPSALTEVGAAPAELYLSSYLPLEVPKAVFGQAVQTMARKLGVPPAWVMAVMYAESRFDASVYNRKGSGAVGLIQFMPSTAMELGTSSQALSNMSPVAQLAFVQAYFEQVKQRYGPYQSLTDFYLAVLFPKARLQDPCYILYHRPGRAYQQNAGLDLNGDGAVSVSDIDHFLQRKFPEAYQQNLNELH